jgi:hypothetical protein
VLETVSEGENVRPIDADELDKEQIQQLHAATLQISGNCFELKKLCATVLVAAGTLIASFTSKHVDSSLFLAGCLVVLVFWVADGQSYYIQAKLRRRMRDLQMTRTARVAELNDYDVSGVGLPAPLQKDDVRSAAIKSLFNASMLYYLLLAALLLLGWLLFLLGAIA